MTSTLKNSKLRIKKAQLSAFLFNVSGSSNDILPTSSHKKKGNILQGIQIPKAVFHGEIPAR